MSTVSYDLECDVAVVGYGGAGATAAITAHDSGAEVIVLEKMPRGGGNTQLSGGTIFKPKAMEVTRYFETLAFGTTEPEIIQTFVAGAMKVGDWVKEIGGEVELLRMPIAFGFPHSTTGAAFPRLPGAEFVAKQVIKGTPAEGTNAQRLWKLLSSVVERRGIKVLTGTPAKELITNPDGEVIGVIAEKDGKRISVKAKRAVVLTCGGFEYDNALKWDFLPFKPCHAFGNPGNTGDGIRMAQKVGAAIWHMSSVSAYIGYKPQEFPFAFQIRFLHEGFIFVAREGKRFVNEVRFELHDMWRAIDFFDPDLVAYPYIPAYAVFDDTTRRKGPLYTGIMGLARDAYQWSLDNSKEVARGWILQAKSIPELAKKMSANEENLKDTLTRYNEYCKAGRDADFGRSRETLLPIQGPPYYAIELWPSLINTQGGPRRDKESRVLDPTGKPIGRLYAAGELGSIWGFMYQGSTNVGECLVFGRIAGQNAAGEKPWS